MWILESSSELFQGRRMWLKPGKSYLFGRVKKDGVRFAIEHKTISRKHFIIKIDDVKLEDVGNIHTRSRLTIEDQNSKAGTTVNGEHIKGSSRDLKKEENYIKPGSLPQDLVIKWHPVVLTYNLLKKELKSGLLKDKQARVRDLDIKAVSEYVAGQTTHLVVNKRNTPKSLQALIDGRPLVAESYIDSLEYATTPSDLNEEENLSPLEQDFDSAWPQPYDHLPPIGREPTSRPAESYEPDSKRKQIFENFTFVFLDQNQYDNLLPPITTGHGKALLYKIAAGHTTTEELVTFLQNAAGHKGFGDAQKDHDKGGVILIRYKGDAGSEDWTNDLVNEACLKLDQRAVDQGEFLDAILASDAMLLRQSVPFEKDHDKIVPSSATVPASNPPSQQSQVEAASLGSAFPHREMSQSGLASQAGSGSAQINGNHQAMSRQNSELLRANTTLREQSISSNELAPSPRKARFVAPKKSRVLDFDDDFDPDMVTQYHEEDIDNNGHLSPSQRDVSPEPPDSDHRGIKDEPISSKKRARPSSQAEVALNKDDDMEDLLPAAAVMKRRKLATQANNDTVPEPPNDKLLSALSKKPKADKPLDVRKIAKAQREAEDERIKREEEDEEEFRIEPGQTLPVYDVETVLIELPTRVHPVRETTQATGDRWDPKWNGRKNFKGFRRAKDNSRTDVEAEPRRRIHDKTIVPLVDGKVSTYGMGDQYWDKTEEEKERERERRRKISQRTTQSQSDQSRVSHRRKSLTVDDSDDEDHEDARNGDEMRTSPEVARLQHEAEEIMNHSVDVDEPRRTRASATQTTTTQSVQGRKRAANGAGNTDAAKKQKTLPITVVHGSDSDDSDDMKFKFGSRRRGRGK